MNPTYIVENLQLFNYVASHWTGLFPDNSNGRVLEKTGGLLASFSPFFLIIIPFSPPPPHPITFISNPSPSPPFPFSPFPFTCLPFPLIC
jgi:hypothetical protein